VAHDELGLGVVLRGLMQAFDRRHLAPAFGDFDPVAQQHQASAEAMRREALQRQRRPQATQGVRLDRRGMEEIQ